MPIFWPFSNLYWILDPELQGLIKQVDGVTLIDDNAVAASIAGTSQSAGLFCAIRYLA